MSATLTIHLDSDVYQLAEQEAKARQTTLPEVVAHQLRVMARNWQESRAGRTPITDALRGAVKLPPDFDERAALTEELQKEHGVGARPQAANLGFAPFFCCMIYGIGI
jgi:hypothetical protein